MHTPTPTMKTNTLKEVTLFLENIPEFNLSVRDDKRQRSRGRSQQSGFRKPLCKQPTDLQELDCFVGCHNDDRR